MKRLQEWGPLFVLFCVPMMMGMEGGEWLPVVYGITNYAGSWLGSRTGVKKLSADFAAHRSDFAKHVEDENRNLIAHVEHENPHPKWSKK
jgi:hypothetical protein